MTIFANFGPATKSNGTLFGSQFFLHSHFAFDMSLRG
jgi:hypothetical protein